ncbi:alpha/beta hydrolase-fold protein [Arenibacter sp. F26102]|uniref:carboxylesterase family protein n=1 Tax=Arenibacter sp. F26102 TaxID=2926416 RepID=UPI001FF44A77|nr:alpha/beta hydrolase-fold protein [Arenibacter sp. F26102]
MATFVATLAYTLWVYTALSDRELWEFIPKAFIMLLSVGAIYSVSLFTSGTRHKRWLFWVGIIGLSLELSLIALMFWSIYTTSETIPLTIQRITPWFLVALSLTLTFYILNFKEELSLFKNKDNSKPSKLLTGISNTLGIISTIGIIVVLNSGFSEYSWEKGKVARSKLLAGNFEARTYVNIQNDTLRYRLLLPKNYDSNKKYPLVVNLHDGSGVGKDNLIHLQATSTAQLLATDENREKYPSFIFMPQSPSNAGFGGVLNEPDISSLVFEAMDYLEQEYNIDDKRRYVIGMSLGGYGSWHFIGVKPEKFAAAVPICGGGDPVLASKMTNIPIWAFHGKDDKAVPVDLTRNMINAIREAGGSPKYTEFSSGHIIWDKVKNTHGFLDWIFAQKRTD